MRPPDASTGHAASGTVTGLTDRQTAGPEFKKRGYGIEARSRFRRPVWENLRPPRDRVPDVHCPPRPTGVRSGETEELNDFAQVLLDGVAMLPPPCSRALFFWL